MCMLIYVLILKKADTKLKNFNNLANIFFCIDMPAYQVRPG